MTYYSGRNERERRERDTPERIVEIARKKGVFTVSLRYRDDWLRERCQKLKRAGLLRGGKRNGGDLYYYPASVDRSGEADETSTKIEGSAEGESAVPKAGAHA